MKTNIAYILLAFSSLLFSGCSTRSAGKAEIQPIGTRTRISTYVGLEKQAEKTIETRLDGRIKEEEVIYHNRDILKPRFIKPEDYLRL